MVSTNKKTKSEQGLAPQTPKGHRLSAHAVRLHGSNILFMLPAFVLFAYVVLIPFFQGLPYSLTNWKSIISKKDPDFVGLNNYKIMLQNPYFINAFKHTFQFTLIY